MRIGEAVLLSEIVSERGFFSYHSLGLCPFVVTVLLQDVVWDSSFSFCAMRDVYYREELGSRKRVFCGVFVDGSCVRTVVVYVRYMCTNDNVCCVAFGSKANV